MEPASKQLSFLLHFIIPFEVLWHYCIIFFKKDEYFLGEFIHILIGMLSFWHLADARYLERQEICKVGCVCVLLCVVWWWRKEVQIILEDEIPLVVTNWIGCQNCKWRKGETNLWLICLFKILNPKRRRELASSSIAGALDGEAKIQASFINSMAYQQH